MSRSSHADGAEPPPGSAMPSDVEPPSKSQAKRDAHALRELGETLAALGEAQRRRLPMDDDVRAALEELVRIKAHGARKRQLGFLAKRLRRIDAEPLLAALDEIREAARAQTHDHHRVEMWRDRLLGDGPAESPAEALTAFLDEHGDVDRQALRRLQQTALAERTSDRPPAAARKLFRLVRDTLDTDRRTRASADGVDRDGARDGALEEDGNDGTEPRS